MRNTGDELRTPADPGHASVVRTSVLRFAASSVVALLVLGIGSVLIAERIARNEALDDARRKAMAIGQTVAAPLVTAGVRAGKPRATGRLDRVMRNRMADGTLSHIKLWSPDGTVIWADESRLVGDTFELPDEVTRLFGTEGTVAEISRLNRAENLQERGEGELLEVYAGATDADGRPVVFEAYLPTAAMHDGEQNLIRNLLPWAIGSLLLFQFAILPMALSLARRVDQAQAERARMMRHALLASDLERRRIAHDLHDGVIQDLAGIGYALPSIGSALSSPIATAAREALHTASEVLHRDLAILRSMLTDIYPPELDGGRLSTALEDLAASTQERGPAVTIRVDDDLRLSDDAARLVYRVVREALRNVVKHARATTSLVEVARDHEQVVVRITDDGRGMVPGATRTDGGHLGLRLLEDTIRDYGGTLTLTRAAIGGTVLEATLPLVTPRS